MACTLPLATMAVLVPVVPAAAVKDPGTARASTSPLPAQCRPGPGKNPPWLTKLPVTEQLRIAAKQWYQDWRATTVSLCVDPTQLAAQNPGRKLAWRHDKGLLFRGTGTDSYSVPSAVFTQGLVPRGTRSNAGLKLRPGVSVPNSGLSSTSYRSRQAKYFGTWIYVIDAPGGIQVDKVLNGAAMNHESEVAFPGGIRAEHIVGAFRLKKPGVWSKASEYRANPAYRGPIAPPEKGYSDVFFGSGPTPSMREVQAKGGTPVDPYARVFRFPNTADKAALSSNLQTKDPLYVPWGSLPAFHKEWVTAQQDPYISPQIRPYATCHQLDDAEYAPGVGGMTDAVSEEHRSRITELGNKFLLPPGACYTADAPPRDLGGAANGSRLSLSWSAPETGKDQVKAYVLYGRNREDAPWRRLAKVNAPATTYVMTPREAKPFALAALNPQRYPGHIAVTAVLKDGTQTAPERP